MYYYKDDIEIVFHCLKIKVQWPSCQVLFFALCTGGYTLHNYFKINIDRVLADLTIGQVYSVV